MKRFVIQKEVGEEEIWIEVAQENISILKEFLQLKKERLSVVILVGSRL